MLLASCGLEVKVHEWPEGKYVTGIGPKKQCSTHSFKNVTWSCSGNQLLAVPSIDKPTLIKFPDKNKSRCVTDVLVEPLEIDVASFSKTLENVFAFGTPAGEINTFDLKTSEILKEPVYLPNPPIFLDYAYDDAALAAGSKNGQIFIINPSGNISSTFYVQWSHSLSAMQFHPIRRNILAAASKEGIVTLWDINTSATKFTAKNHVGAVTDLTISASDELLATIGVDRMIYFYDLRTKEVVFSKLFSSDLTSIVSNPINDDFALGTSKGRILCFDRRQPEFSKGSFGVQKGIIKSMKFNICSVSEKKSNTDLKKNVSANILQDDSTTTSNITTTNTEILVSNSDSDKKTQASGDFSLSEDKTSVSRIPGGMDDGLEKSSYKEQWLDQLPDSSCDVKKIPFYQLIDESCLNALRDELVKTSKDLMQKFMEDMTTQFLKIRMGVSREFCLMETSNNKRWQDFNVTLLRLAGFDETKKEHDLLSETQASEDSELLGSRQQDSLYSPAKTKMTNYSHQKPST